jgi:hypothetical protein
MSDFAWLPRIGYLGQTFEQHWQHRSIHFDLVSEGLQTRRAFFLLSLVRAFPIREAGAEPRTQPLGLLLLTQGPLRLLAGSPLLLDRFAARAAAALAHGSTLLGKGPPHSR